VSGKFIPYGRQFIDDMDIASVTEVLQSDYLTTGPKINEFECAVGSYVGADYAVAVSSGTAALHCAMYALDIKQGDEVIIPTITFAATANGVLYMGGRPVFADVEPDSLLMDPDDVEKKVTENTRAIIAVDYAGHPCRYDRLKEIAHKHSLSIVSDSCHALGAEYGGKKCGTIADLTCFSFHPLKHITTGEGGMITTDSAEQAERMRRFRNHGINADHLQRSKLGTWYYEVVDLGFNYRITDFQCALGIAQMEKLPRFLGRRREIAALYDNAFSSVSGIQPLEVSEDVFHAYHLYVIKVHKKTCGRDRGYVFNALRDADIGVNVHYIPVHMHPYYRKRFDLLPGLCPVAEKVYEEILSLPVHPSMSDDDVDRVILAVREAVGA